MATGLRSVDSSGVVLVTFDKLDGFVCDKRVNFVNHDSSMGYAGFKG